MNATTHAEYTRKSLWERLSEPAMAAALRWGTAITIEILRLQHDAVLSHYNFSEPTGFEVAGCQTGVMELTWPGELPDHAIALTWRQRVA